MTSLKISTAFLKVMLGFPCLMFPDSFFVVFFCNLLTTLVNENDFIVVQFYVHEQ